MKKLISLLAAVSMLPIIQPVMAKEKLDISQKTEVLEGLNIVGEDVPQSITWGDYLSALEGMMSDDKNEDAVKFAENYGLINERISAGEKITYQDAIKILVRAGGYSERIPGYSEDAAYIRTAGERKLTDGITLSYSDSLTGEAMILMLYNALDADIMDFEFDGNKYKTETKTDETILSRYRKIKEKTGILSDNGDSGLNYEDTRNKNSIVVGKTEIKKNEKYKKDYLGYNVRTFYKDENGDYSLEYLYPTENRVLSLSGDNVESTDFSELYYMDENKKSKRVRLDAAIKVVYNGQAYFNYTAADFTAEENDITLIDNNDDGTYEAALITSYETIAASYVTTYDSKIINKYKYAGAPDRLDIASDSNDYKMRYYLNGERIEKPEIKVWNILSVATSRGTNPIRSIYISTESVEGTVSQTYDDKFIINEEEYELNSAFVSARAAGDSAVPEITLGNEYIFYLDIHGRIAAISSLALQEIDYAVMIKMSQDDDDEEKIRVKYMDSIGDWHESYLRKKVRFYDDTHTGNSLKASKIFNLLVNAKGRITPQVVQLSENGDGEINVLKIAVSSQKSIKDKLTVGNTVTGCYRWTTKLLGTRNNIALYIADDATIFLLPQGYSTNEEDYSVRAGALDADETYTVTPYNIDKFGQSDCISMRDSDGGAKADNLFVVSYVSKIVDSNDEVKTALFGQYGDYSDYSITAKDNSLFDGIGRGDVLELYMNKKSQIVNIEKIYTSASGFNPYFYYDYGGRVSGYVEDVDPEAKRLSLNCGESGKVGLKANESQYALNVYMCDRSKKGVEKLDFSDITKGDFVVTTVHYACLNNVIIIK